MNDANDIAKYIIVRETIDGRRITNLRLNALLFLIQLIHLCDFFKHCYKNKIYAWGCGPVIPDVYNRYKIYAGSQLTISMIDDVFEYNISDSAKESVDLVLDNLKDTETSKILDAIRKRKSYRIPFQMGKSEITLEHLMMFYYEDWRKING